MAPFGVDVVVDYPKCPQDLNAIENAWNVLCHWWDVTVPARLESREDCVNRLQAAVLKGVNAYRAEQTRHHDHCPLRDPCDPSRDPL